MDLELWIWGYGYRVRARDKLGLWIQGYGSRVMDIGAMDIGLGQGLGGQQHRTSIDILGMWNAAKINCYLETTLS